MKTEKHNIQLKNLLERRVIFVVGKGGVGKTTISMALGLLASQQKKRVLLVEVGNADAIGPFFGKGSLPETPFFIQDNLWGVRIDPRAVMEEYLHAHIGVNFIANRIKRSKLFEGLAHATPGLREAMTIGQIWRWEQEGGKNPTYDTIIVDAPATGHGLSLLRVPQTLVDMLVMGPVAEQTKVVLDMLRDQDRTQIFVVALAEELPVSEAIEFYQVAENELQMPVQLFFLNAIYPKVFSHPDIKHLQAVLDAQKDFIDEKSRKALVDISKRSLIRRELQERYCAQLAESTQKQIIEVPFFFTNSLTMDDLIKITAIIEGSSGGAPTYV